MRECHHSINSIYLKLCIQVKYQHHNQHYQINYFVVSKETEFLFSSITVKIMIVVESISTALVQCTRPAKNTYYWANK